MKRIFLVLWLILLPAFAFAQDAGAPAGPPGPDVRELADDGSTRYNAAVCLDGSTIYGSYRKVHQPLGENMSYSAGDSYHAFDTPVGRVGMQICYDKAFPEAARMLALDGAEIVVSMSAWPAARTATADNLQEDRWTYRFNQFDIARALDNQVFWMASNQSGTFGSLRYVGNAKVVDPGGNILATTLLGTGLAIAEIDVDGQWVPGGAVVSSVSGRDADGGVDRGTELVGVADHRAEVG